MSPIKSLLYSLMATIISTICIWFALHTDFAPILLLLKNDLSIFQLIKIGICIFAYLFMIVMAIISAISAIYHLLSVLIHALFHDNKQINVTVDENYIIRDSFIELSNGKVIPIKIKKIIMNKPETEEKVTEEIGE